MTIPKKVRDALRERSSSNPERGRCEVCGRPGNNAHHRKNKSQLGPDTLSNLLLLCGSGTTGCHGVITENPEWACAQGYSVRSYQQPYEVAVYIKGRGRVFLQDNGDCIPEEDVA